MSDTIVLSLGASAGCLTAAVGLLAAPLTYIAARRGSRETRQSSVDSMFLTRLTGVEDDLRDERELIAKERKEHADIVISFREAAILDHNRIRDLEFQLTQLKEVVKDGLEDFLKCQKNVRYLAAQLRNFVPSIDLESMGISLQLVDNERKEK